MSSKLKENEHSTKNATATRPIATDETDSLSIGSTIKDDLIGAKDWRRSKIGYLVGFFSFARMASSLYGNARDSISRTGSLLRDTVATENILPLPSELDGDTPHNRFNESMRLHNRSEQDLLLILRNTRRAGWFFVIISLCNLSFSLFTIYFWPVNGFLEAVVRTGPLPLVLALIFKNFYTNWIIRTRQLGSPSAFLKSGDWLPKLK